jgi:hypothetical protein
MPSWLSKGPEPPPPPPSGSLGAPSSSTRTGNGEGVVRTDGPQLLSFHALLQRPPAVLPCPLWLHARLAAGQPIPARGVVQQEEVQVVGVQILCPVPTPLTATPPAAGAQLPGMHRQRLEACTRRRSLHRGPAKSQDNVDSGGCARHLEHLACASTCQHRRAHARVPGSAGGVGPTARWRGAPSATARSAPWRSCSHGASGAAWTSGTVAPVGTGPPSMHRPPSPLCTIRAPASHEEPRFKMPRGARAPHKHEASSSV